MSSLDNLLTYREEKAAWKRRTSLLQLTTTASGAHGQANEEARNSKSPSHVLITNEEAERSSIERAVMEVVPSRYQPSPSSRHQRTFRHVAAEVGFCFTIAMTQFLAEYLISGFALELPNLVSGYTQTEAGSMSIFWPACLLSLTLSATLLVFARISDIHGGYAPFMFGVAWLAIWTLVPGFCTSVIMLDVSRAMQGLAIAAFMPSTFAMVGNAYACGPRKNFVMGLYSGCAPLGFFTGFLVAGALPHDQSRWYFWIASALSVITLITAFLTVPSDGTDRRKLDLKMDWIGSALIASGLILVAYALAVEPYADQSRPGESHFTLPVVLGPFIAGFACLLIAFWYEGWYATCPLLPFDFFKPRSIKAFSFACLCFYASYGIWLYGSAQYFQSGSAINSSGPGLSDMELVLWYTPTAVGGVILCIVGGSLMHIVPTMILLFVSALAWIAAPLLLALAPLPLDYWKYVLPSMLCATIGIDLTFTVSIIFFSSVQPLQYQGLSGAVCSILVNLAMSFALVISEIVAQRADKVVQTSDSTEIPSSPGQDSTTDQGFRASFLYASASACLGFIICILFVRISRSAVRQTGVDVERPASATSASTLMDENDNPMERIDLHEDVRSRHSRP